MQKLGQMENDWVGRDFSCVCVFRHTAFNLIRRVDHSFDIINQRIFSLEKIHINLFYWYLPPGMILSVELVLHFIQKKTLKYLLQ
jgi:hypothetical protein